MARIVAGAGTSHIPAVGAALDRGEAGNDYWRPIFAGFEPAREWIAGVAPDVAIIVYNDHASAFSLELTPTFTLGLADRFLPADQGYGRRKVPAVEGNPELATHLLERLVAEEFDMAQALEMDVDHGLTVPLSVFCGAPDAWPFPVIPLAVNVIKYPQPTARRCMRLGEAIGRAVASFGEDLRVAVIGTGGMSHQLQGERAGMWNPEFDHAFLDDLTADPERLAGLDHVSLVREAGSEGMELIMWLVMRGALGDAPREAYRFYHYPASNTALGLIAFDCEPAK
ncbi:class III extradiol dioxygenase subunit beta [Ovoidimarina sediminis]|uniref:class III extradiol dioxygenase subunit beta n=1 Tax=Ovoidimarina sediminis TaxID=3079856 RepID=UPI002914C5DA|nr:class III extradiol dioxygenase subunit beta [Rhodophyticola sp. MJ-SS7]MDU8944686.1 class III extradiol dioxygenase subunit beta [Rhodophyticola sp. MJ-SS7]